MRKLFSLVLAIVLVGLNFVTADAEDMNPWIKQGDYGTSVIVLHQKLIELGLFGLRAESPYGPQSVDAVKLLQKTLGLDVTGVVSTQEELDTLMTATIDANTNLATGTDESITVAPAGSKNWCNPIELYPTSELGLALLKSIKTFSVSFDWTATDVDTAVDASISLRYTGSEKTRYAPVGYFEIPVGDSSGHCEVIFEPNEDMRLHGTGWLIGEIGEGVNPSMNISLSNFLFVKSE